MGCDPLATLEAVIDSNWERQVRWLQTLVRFQSLRGHEAPCQEWLAKEFEARGWIVDLYTLADARIHHLPGYAPLVGVDPARSVQVVATVLPSADTAAGLPHANKPHSPGACGRRTDRP